MARLISTTPYGLFDGLGVLLWIFGFGLEWIADRSLRQAKESGVKLLTTGVWSWCRHPNYLGDALVWWGFALMSINSPIGLCAPLSACLMTFLLSQVSGVPLLEAKMRERGVDRLCNAYPSVDPKSL